jgi:Na+-driven multidrug efflux pump
MLTGMCSRRLCHIAGKTTMQKINFLISKNNLLEVLSIIKNVIPVCIAVGLAAAIGLVDVHLAGNLGSAVQAGVGIGDQALFFAALMGTGIAQACGSLMARATGANKPNEAKSFAATGLMLASLLGAAASILTFAGALYLKLCSIANAPYCLMLTQSAILRAMGKSFSTIFPWLVAASISIALSICLPQLMPNGRQNTLEYIALAWNLGALVAVCFGHVELRKCGFCIYDRYCNSQRVFESAKQIFTLGLPIALTEAAWLGSNFIIYLILAQMPEPNDAQAAWTLRLKIEEIAAAPLILASSMTAASLVGQTVGAGNFAKAAKTADNTAIFAALLLLCIGAIVCLNSEYLAGLHATTQQSADCMRIFLWSSLLIYPLSAFYSTIFGALEGAGSTVKPMLAVVCGLFLLRIPMSALLAVFIQMGIAGIVVAVLISHIAVALSAVSQLRTFFADKKPATKVPILAFN